MKKTMSVCAIAALVVLAGCDGSAPPKKAVEVNKNAPPAGSLENPDKKIKDALKKADDASAKNAVPPAAPKTK